MWKGVLGWKWISEGGTLAGLPRNFSIGTDPARLGKPLKSCLISTVHCSFPSANGCLCPSSFWRVPQFIPSYSMYGRSSCQKAARDFIYTNFSPSLSPHLPPERPQARRFWAPQGVTNPCSRSVSEFPEPPGSNKVRCHSIPPSDFIMPLSSQHLKTVLNPFVFLIHSENRCFLGKKKEGAII